MTLLNPFVLIKICFVFADSEVESKNAVIEENSPKSDLTTKGHYCKICCKNFHANHFLQTHMKTCHEGTMEEKQCRICFRKFSAHSSLLNHLKIKHGATKLPNELAQTVPKGKSDLRFLIADLRLGLQIWDVCQKDFEEKLKLSE